MRAKMKWLSRLTKRRPPARDRRRHPRYPTPMLSCDWGTLVDLSISGMRLACTRKPPAPRGTLLTLILRNEHQKLPVNGKLVRLQRRGLSSFEVGIAFVGVDAAQAQALFNLARFGFIATMSRPQPHQAPAKPRVSAAVTDLYAILGVPHDATAEMIRQAYRDKARLHHPDANPSGESAKLFQLTHDAYATLKNPKTRQAYDRVIGQAAAPHA